MGNFKLLTMHGGYPQHHWPPGIMCREYQLSVVDLPSIAGHTQVMLSLEYRCVWS